MHSRDLVRRRFLRLHVEEELARCTEMKRENKPRVVAQDDLRNDLISLNREVLPDAAHLFGRVAVIIDVEALCLGTEPIDDPADAECDEQEIRENRTPPRLS